MRQALKLIWNACVLCNAKDGKATALHSHRPPTLPSFLARVFKPLLKVLTVWGWEVTWDIWSPCSAHVMHSEDLPSTWGLTQPPPYEQRQAEKLQVMGFFLLFIRKREESKEETETESQPIKGMFEGLLEPSCKLLLSVCPVCVSCPAKSRHPPTGWRHLFWGASLCRQQLSQHPCWGPFFCFLFMLVSSKFSPLPTWRPFSKWLHLEVQQQSPTILAPGPVLWKTSVSTTQRQGDGFRMIQAHHIYCALHFCYYISSTSDHQPLDSRGWGPPLYWLKLPLLCCVSSSSPTPDQISLPNARWTFPLMSHRHLQHIQNWN